MATPCNVTSKPLSDAEVEEVLALLREGRYTIDGGRAWTSYRHENGRYIEVQSEDGESYKQSISEEALRLEIARKTQPFRTLLLEKPWAAFSAAFVADDRILARQLLRETLVHSDYYFLVLDSFLAWPEEKPKADDLPDLAKSLPSLAAEAFGLAVPSERFDRDRTTYLRGAAFLETLNEMAGNPGGHHHCCARYHERGKYYHLAAQNYRSALADPICMKHHMAKSFPYDLQEMLDKAAQDEP